MMRSLVMTLILILILSQSIQSQSFEGTLVYVTDIELSDILKSAGITKDILIERMLLEGSWSDTIRVSYKNGDYFTSMENHKKPHSVYKAETNRIYSFQAGEDNDICTITDASVDFESTLTGMQPQVIELDTTVLIHPYTCHIIRIKWKSGTTDYYYDPSSLQMDPMQYEKHIYDGWSAYLKLAKSLPIRITKTINGVSTLTYTLVRAIRHTVDESCLILPELIPITNANEIKITNQTWMRIKK